MEKPLFREALRGRDRWRSIGCFALGLGMLLFLCLLTVGGGWAGANLIGRALEDQPAVNILILGLDRRRLETEPARSDSLLVVSIDPRGRIALLAIPRDLYVIIPGYGYQRINTAHFYGERRRPGEGPQLAMRTVAANLGIPIHYYMRLDFRGFRAIVDGLGGISVEVEREIVDTRYPTDDYGYTTIRIPAGRVHMDGEMALQYVRTRHGSSDLERIQRQEQVLVALLQEALRPATLPRLPQLFQALRWALDTDLPSEELPLLGLWAWRAGPQGIVKASIDASMTRAYITADGANVLFPDWDKIHALLRELFPLA